MRRAAFLSIGLFLAAHAAHAQPVLDTSVHTFNTSTSVSGTISTSGTNRVLKLCVFTNTANANTVTSPSLTWTKRGSCVSGENASGATCNAASQRIEMWEAWAAAQLASEVVTVSHSASTDNGLTIASFSGAYSSTGFNDPNASLPAGANSNAYFSLSTTRAKTLPIGCYRLNGPSASAYRWETGTNYGATTIAPNTDYILTAIPSTPITIAVTGISLDNLSVAQPNGGIADAITSDGVTAGPRFIQ